MSPKGKQATLIIYVIILLVPLFGGILSGSRPNHYDPINIGVNALAIFDQLFGCVVRIEAQSCVLISHVDNFHNKGLFFCFLIKSLDEMSKDVGDVCIIGEVGVFHVPADNKGIPIRIVINVVA